MKRLRLLPLVALLLLGAASVTYAAVAFQAFGLKSLGTRVEVTWTTSREVGCTEFVVERSVDGVEFFPIATGIAPHGSGQEYRYIDSGVYKETVRTFYYRVVGKTSSGSQTLTDVKQVTVDVSDIQRTWGGLKAMFR